ncbi:MAG: Tetracycline resistance protein, class B [Firmicutes bacterium]|nr:Tetracycline resistance protein, class B [candidate division NPL-UPA2 bacterium]MBT9155096.1 Tetracycline resistance protein, class B [candidate division NPL-UPA2 bacterium]
MELWRRNLLVLWVGTVFAGISFSLVSPFLPMLLKDVGVVENLEVWSGWAFAATFYTSALMAPLWGSLADKYGRRLQLVRAGMGIGATYILLSFATNGWQVIFLRLLLGLFNGFIPTAIAMVAVNTPEEHMGPALGVIQSGGAFGSVIGPLVGGYMSYFLGIQQTLMLAGMSLFVATMFTVMFTNETHKGDRSLKRDVLDDIRQSLSKPFLVQMFVLVLIFNIALMVIQPLLPIFILQLAGERDAAVPTGIIFALAGIATVLAAPRWGRLSATWGERKVLRVALIGAAAVSVLTALSTSLYMLGGMRFVLGLFIAALMPISTMLIAKSVPTNFRSRALALNNSFGQFGAALGPTLGGYMALGFGVPSVFVGMGVLLAVVAVAVERVRWQDAPTG